MIVSVLGLAVLPGCGLQPKGNSGAAVASSSSQQSDSAVQTAMVFAPERLRVHPLTRIVRQEESGRTVVEAHIELLDHWGDSTKWLGVLAMELYRPGAGGAAGGQEQVNVWNLDLTDPEANAQAYDRVTRTYRATLTGVSSEPNRTRGWSLRVTFNTPQGRQLSDTHRFGE